MPAFKKKIRVDDDAAAIHTGRRQKISVDNEDVNIPDGASDAELSDCDEAPSGKRLFRVDEDVDKSTDSPLSNAEVSLRGLDATMTRRVLAMRSYVDKTRGVYSITKFPDDLRFGRDHAFNMSNFLVRQGGDNMAATVWAVGRIASCGLYDNQGSPRPQAYISIMPLAQDDVKAAAKIYNVYSNPLQDSLTNPFGTIIAGRSLTKYQSDKPPEPFKAVYLADTALKAKRSMLRYDPKKLKRGDLVLLEMRVRKRFEATNKDVPKSDQEHTIAFQLQAVNFLRSGNDDDMPDAEDDVEYDF